MALSVVPNRETRRKIVCLLLVLSGCFCVTAFMPMLLARQPAPPATTHMTQGSDGYVGSAQCASCHQSIYSTYVHTKMGRSMEAVTPEIIAGMSLPASVYSKRLDRHFDVYTKDGKLYQSESQTDAEGKEVFRNTQQMDWIMGAGTNGYGAVLRRGDFLFEAPLSFYTQAGTWELSPGYGGRDISFNRPIQADCIFCHSGRPKPLDAKSGAFAPQPFEQLAIGCESCHGPGAAHIQAMRAHPTMDAAATIANPDEMTAPRVNDLCMSCHEGGESRVPKPGKTYADFRPGDPLDKTLSIFMAPMRRDSPDDTEHVQHYLQMSMSKCFRASGGTMSCTTCHDPHSEPTREQATAYFNARCATCHTVAQSPCTAPANVRQASAPADNCIGCHMPRKVATESAHTTLANHRILLRPDEPWPDAAFQMTVAPLTDLVDLDPPANGHDTLPATTLLAAYADIMQQRPEYSQAYLKALSAAEHDSPDNADVQRALGLHEILQQAPQAAVGHLQRSIALAPNDAQTYAYLSEAFRRQSQLDDATAAIETAVKLAPYNQPMQRTLVASLLAQRRFKDADSAAQHYIEIFPEDRRMSMVLLQIRASE